MENDFRVNDNFLTEQDFGTIRDTITAGEFQWSFSQYVDSSNEEPTPGQFVHTVYFGNVPCSPFYNSLVPIIEHKLGISALYRIKLNLQPRLPEPFKYSFHSDLSHDFEKDVASHWTTAIFYINTNNGYTEFQDGRIEMENTKVKSVANRMVSFPANLRHRGTSCTNERKRVVINFNYFENT